MDAPAPAGLSGFPAARAALWPDRTGREGVQQGSGSGGAPRRGSPRGPAPLVAHPHGTAPWASPSPAPPAASRLCHLVPSASTGTDPASHPQGNGPAALENSSPLPGPGRDVLAGPLRCRSVENAA